jgi:hypothetical protein
MVLSTLAFPGTHPNAHRRLFVGHERTRSARAPPGCWFLPRRRPRKPPMDTEQLSGMPNSCVLAFVLLVLHPWQQAGAHLACTRPPDFVVSRRSFMVSAHRPVSSLSLDPRCDSCLRFLAGRSDAALGLRVTCIRRVESSGGLLATSFGGLQHFHGPHMLYGRPSSPA